jgi:hypothetical protein
MDHHGRALAVIAALALFAPMLAGCGGGPEVDSAALAAAPLPKSQARVKIHRESNIMGMAVDVRVMIDGKEVAGLGNDETKVFNIPAGAHQIAVDHWSHPGTSKLDLNAKPGMVYDVTVAVRGEAAAAGMMFGIVGTVAESAANGDNGYWSVRLVKQTPAA